MALDACAKLHQYVFDAARLTIYMECGAPAPPLRSPRKAQNNHSPPNSNQT
jgi:hypothetical protein